MTLEPLLSSITWKRILFRHQKHFLQTSRPLLFFCSLFFGIKTTFFWSSKKFCISEPLFFDFGTNLFYHFFLTSEALFSEFTNHFFDIRTTLFRALFFDIRTTFLGLFPYRALILAHFLGESEYSSLTSKPCFFDIKPIFFRFAAAADTRNLFY